MLTFTPPELLSQLKNALASFDFCEPFEEFYPIAEADFDPSEYDDNTITEDTTLSLYPIGGQGEIEATVRQCIEYAATLETEHSFDRRAFHCHDCSIFYIHPVNDRAFSFAHSGDAPDIDLHQNLTCRGKNVLIDIDPDSPEFVLALAKQGRNDTDHLPINGFAEPYVRVDHPDGLDLPTAKAIAGWYLFELSALHSLDFEFAVFPEFSEEWEELTLATETVPSAVRPRLRLHSLDISQGLPELHHLYLKAIAAGDVEHRFLNLVKVLEFVSATIVKTDGHRRIKAMLQTSATLAPNAQYLDNLIALVDQLRSYRKDAEALRLTLHACCSASILAPLAPTCVPKLRSLAPKDDLKTQNAALSQLSVCISATRNQLVHAKADYTLTGDECPSNQLSQLTDCTQAAAIQAIRHYAELNESMRVNA